MTHTFPLLQDLIIILLASVTIAFIFNRLRQPTIVGFMLTGVLIGPYGLGLIKDIKAIETLAEIGVMLLLFTIGLEFSLHRLLKMKREVLLGGGLQVVITTGLITLIAYLSGRAIGQAIFFGFLVALSSTAIVLKSYVERTETDAPHGKVGIGILLFQDLSIVPMMLLIPILVGKEGTSPLSVAVTFGVAMAAVAGIIFVARIVIPFLLNRIVKLHNPEVFIIFIVLTGLGAAFLTSSFGLSLALGAFIAGLVLSESEYSHQVAADMLPLRDVFNSIFFVSIGMLLSLTALGEDWLTVLAWTLLLIAGKTLLILAVVKFLGYSLRVSATAAVGLAQIGEFSFILAQAGLLQGLFPEADYQRFLGAAILSMMATPFLIKAAPRIGHALQRLQKSEPSPDIQGRKFEPKLRDHVIVVGYGLNGRNLARVLRNADVPYLVVELNSELVRAASLQGEQFIFGDATRREILHRAGLEDARILVLAISDPTASRHIVGIARLTNPRIKIIARTRYMEELPELLRLGANDVIPEEFETSIEIFTRVLRDYEISPDEIEQQAMEIRREGYQMLRKLSVLACEATSEDRVLVSTEAVKLSADSAACHKTIKELMLRTQTGITVVAVVRNGYREVNPAADFKLLAGDVLLLLGKPEQIASAIEQFGGSYQETTTGVTL